MPPYAFMQFLCTTCIKPIIQCSELRELIMRSNEQMACFYLIKLPVRSLLNFEM